MLLGSGNPHVQYGGVFLGALGIYPCIPNTISWTANNVEGVYKRGIALGFVIGCKLPLLPKSSFDLDILFSCRSAIKDTG